ncbi:hypothetical protein J5TS2_11560 [Brevibacillus halotolerans]|nr:hypothetical protein J5TS2_11560 [Brevibacillus halotolerans]
MTRVGSCVFLYILIVNDEVPFHFLTVKRDFFVEKKVKGIGTIFQNGVTYHIYLISN